MKVKEFVAKELGEEMLYVLVKRSQVGCMRSDAVPLILLYKNQLLKSEYANLEVDYFEVLTKKRMKLIVG